MRRPNLVAGLYLLLVFVSGGAVGFFAHHLYLSSSVIAKAPPHNSEEFRRQYLNEMQQQLGLSGAQMNQLNAILDATRAEYREKIRPQVKTLQEQQVAKIRAILDDTQRAKYEKMRQDREKKNAAAKPASSH